MIVLACHPISDKRFFCGVSYFRRNFQIVSLSRISLHVIHKLYVYNLCKQTGHHTIAQQGYQATRLVGHHKLAIFNVHEFS